MGEVYLKDNLSNKHYYLFNVSLTPEGKLTKKMPFILFDKKSKKEEIITNVSLLKNKLMYFTRNMEIINNKNNLLLRFLAKKGIYINDGKMRLRYIINI